MTEPDDDLRQNPPLKSLVRGLPCAVPAATPIRQALQRMVEARVGSVAIVDAQSRPLGIFTNYDLLRRVVVPGVDLTSPIEEVMSVPPLTMPEDAAALDAMLEMATRSIHHILLVGSDGCLTGVVSERDLFALQRIGVAHLRRSIAVAQDMEDLRAALAEVRRAAFAMLNQGAGAEQTTQFISAANDAVVRRILELNLRQHDFDGIDWAWLAFGSEGREEQTLATDQDNGIVFICPDLMEREALQLRFLEFAREVNRDLDACGFPLCKGNVMASNPEWCLTLDQWKEKFSAWVYQPEPQALLNATIFFDLRAIWGQENLATQMYQHLFSASRSSAAFRRMLASQALDVAPPLGLIRDFATESAADGAAFIDLKKLGARLFVDAARVLALTHGVYSASTVQRLRRAKELSGDGEDAEGLISAFQFIQLLRLRHQYAQAQAEHACDNRIVPDALNPLDRRILVESFKQAKRLQQKLKLSYQL